MGSCGELKLPRHLPLRFLSKRLCRRLIASQTLLAHMPAWNPLSLHVGRIAPFITQRRWRQEESIHFCILTPGYSTLLRWSNHHIRQHSSAPGAWRIYFFCTILARNPWHLIQPIRNPSTFDCYLHLVVVHPYILLG